MTGTGITGVSSAGWGASGAVGESCSVEGHQRGSEGKRRAQAVSAAGPDRHRRADCLEVVFNPWGEAPDSEALWAPGARRTPKTQ